MSTRADAERKQDQARTLLIAGLTYQQIADSSDPTAPPTRPRRLYASPGAARNAVIAADRRHGGLPAAKQRQRGAGDPPEQVSMGERRDLMRGRLERVLAAHMPKALQGNGESTDRVTRLLAQLAALDGLNIRPAAPVPDVGGEEDDPVDELRTRRARRARDRGAGAPTA